MGEIAAKAEMEILKYKLHELMEEYGGRVLEAAAFSMLEKGGEGTQEKQEGGKNLVVWEWNVTRRHSDVNSDARGQVTISKGSNVFQVNLPACLTVHKDGSFEAHECKEEAKPTLSIAEQNQIIAVRDLMLRACEGSMEAAMIDSLQGIGFFNAVSMSDPNDIWHDVFQEWKTA